MSVASTIWDSSISSTSVVTVLTYVLPDTCCHFDTRTRILRR